MELLLSSTFPLIIRGIREDALAFPILMLSFPCKLLYYSPCATHDTGRESPCGIGVLLQEKLMPTATQPNYHLYIVEDHSIMREVYAQYFSSVDGFDVCGTAASAEEALEQIPMTSPDAVLIDISLPGMNGLALVEKLQQQYPDLCTIIVSGHEDTHYRQAALRAGASDFVSKGSAATILKTLQKNLGTHAA